jgi:hypothetical protein
LSFFNKEAKKAVANYRTAKIQMRRKESGDESPHSKRGNERGP